MHYALSTYSTIMILLVCYVLQTFYVKHGIVNSITYCNRVVHVLVGASAPESLKANNANLEAISKLANSIFAGMKFLRISKVNFCGKLSYESLKRFTILLGKLSCGIFEGDQTVNWRRIRFIWQKLSHSVECGRIILDFPCVDTQSIGYSILGTYKTSQLASLFIIC